MKKSFFGSLIFATIFAMIISCFLGPVFGAMSFTSAFVKKPAGVMNMGLNREVWIAGLKDVYIETNTWLDNAEDLSQFVTEYQTLNFAEAGAYPAVYLNQTTDIDSVEPTETPNAIDLDTYDSQNYKIRNINLTTLPYDKVAFYTGKSAQAIRLKEALAAAWTFTPSSTGALRIIMPTTGDSDGTGYKMATITDIQNLAAAMDIAKFPKEGRNLVLPPKMWWQLINSNIILQGQIQFQQKVGIIDPTIVSWYGIQIHMYTHGVGYDLNATAKAALGTAIGGTVVDCGFVFCKNEVFRASGNFDMAYLAFGQNPAGRAYQFGFQHRFKSGFQRASGNYSAMLYAAADDNV